MCITVATALLMLYLSPGLLSQGWMHVKLGFVVGLLFYHFKSQQIMSWLATGKSTWTSSQLRLWNEVSTIILFAIVFLVIFRSAVDWIYGVVGLLSLAVLLMILIKLYKRYRKTHNEE